MTKMTVASAVLMALAFGLLALGIYRVTLAHSQPAQTCVSVEEQARIRKLYNEAIDRAFQEHIMTLFNVWVKDYSPEPERAKIGTDNAINAYQRAYNLKHWSPLACP